MAVFTVTLDTASGKYTFVQKGPLDHPVSTDPNDSIDLRFDFKVSDSDGDSADGFFKVKVYDDGPTGATTNVSVDETGGLDTVSGTLSGSFGMDGAGKVEITGGPTGLTSHGVAVTLTISADGKTAIGKAGDVTVFTLTLNPTTGAYTFTQSATLDHPNTSDHNDVLNLGFGLKVTDADGDSATGGLNVKVYDDGPTASNTYATVDETGGFDTVAGNLTYSYGADGAGKVELAGPVPTGLTSHGVAVTVTTVGNVITGVAGGVTVFTLTLNPATGAYTFKQMAPLDHPNTGNPDDSLTLGFGFKVTDGDGDSVSTGCLIVTVKDDGPTVCDVSVAVDETGGFDSVSGSIAGSSYGADGAGTVAMVSGPTGLTSHGVAVTTTISADGKTVTGMAGGTVVFTLVLNPATGAFTFTQKAALDHPNGNDHNDVLNLGFGFKVTDGDGDSATGTISVKVYDDGPCINVIAPVTVDESNVHDTYGDKCDGVWGQPGTGSLLSASGQVTGGFGADGAGGITLLQGPAGLTHHGQSVTVTVTGNVATGKLSDGTIVFTLSVNAGTGEYTYKQYASLDHANATNPNDVTSLGFKVAVTDFDGDKAIGNLVVNVLDDAPTAGHTAVVVNQSVCDDGNPNTPLLTATGQSGLTYGGDGEGHLTLTEKPSGVYSEGHPVTIIQKGDSFIGTNDCGQTVFTLEMGCDGTYVYKQYLQVDNCGCGSDSKTLAFGYDIVDADGDKSSGNISVSVQGDVMASKTALTAQLSSVDNTVTHWTDSEDTVYTALRSEVPVANPVLHATLGNGPVLDVSHVLAGQTGDLEDLSRFVHVGDDGHGNTLLQVDATGSGQHFETVAMLQGVTGVSLENMVEDGSVETGRFLNGQ